MTFDEYRKLDAVNWSTLKVMRTSPKHYQYAKAHPRKDTPALAFGRAVHTAVLEPHKFESEYVEWAGGDCKGKAWDTFKVEHAGVTILKTDAIERVRACAESVRTNPQVAPYLATGAAEQTITWTDAATGLVCKARLDWLAPGVLLDLKTSATITKRMFLKRAIQLGYPGQFVHYRNGANANGYAIQKVVSVVAEQNGPFDVGVLHWTPEALAPFEDEVADLLALVMSCRLKGEWPGQYQDEEPIVYEDIPSWVNGEAEFTDVEE